MAKLVDKKKKWIAYVLWFFGGIFGIHHFYLCRDLHAFAMWCTAGGGLGLGWIRDLWRLPDYVKDANEDEEYMKKLIKEMKNNKKPSFSRARTLGQILLSMVLGLTYFWSIPIGNVNNDWDLKFLRFLTPIPISIGVWIVGNIGRQQGRLKPSLITAFIIFALSYTNMPGNLIWCSISSSLAFYLTSTKWKRTPARKHSVARRTLVLGMAGFVYLSLVCSGIYFNTSGEYTKVGVLNDVKEQLILTVNYYRTYGWWKIYQDVIDHMNPYGESTALKILGLNQSATKPEIIARFRALSKEWHPDRHRDELKKQEAHFKFMEYKEAYQTLIQTRGKIKAAQAN